MPSWLSLPAPAEDRSLWLVAGDAAAEAAALRLAEAWDGRFGRLLFYLTTAADRGRPAAPPRRRAAAPLLLRPVLWLALRRLRTRAVIAIGPSMGIGRALAAAAPGMGVAVLGWDGVGDPPEALAAAVLQAARENPRGRRAGGLTIRAARRAVASGLPFGLDRLRVRKLADLQALHEALGWPETIVCIGSGPSSNDDRCVAAAAGAATAIFRVKHRWLAEGRVRRADVAFSGTAETAYRLPRAIVLIQDRETAARFVLERAWRGGFRPSVYGVVEDLLPDFQSAVGDGARLTNGAAMLAIAAALQPKRLFVGGVDLYRHPAGAYPGGPAVANAYAPAHDAETETAFALAVLQAYRARGGTLEAIGPLGDLLADRQGK